MTCGAMCKVVYNQRAIFLDMVELLEIYDPSKVAEFKTYWMRPANDLADWLDANYPEYDWGTSLVSEGACNLRAVLEARRANDKLLLQREGPCSLGCDEYGACYADYYNRPEMCGRNKETTNDKAK